MRAYLSRTKKRRSVSKTVSRRRIDLPYGMWQCSNGRQVLFNRLYEPLWEKTPDGTVTPADPAEWVEWNKQDWFYDDGHTEAQKVARAKQALKDWNLA